MPVTQLPRAYGARALASALLHCSCMTSTLGLVFAVPLLLALAACSSHHDDVVIPPTGCPAGATCESATAGPVHGTRADGSVDITAKEAWPDRPIEPAALTEAEIATACASWARCYRDPHGNAVADPDRLELLQLCLGTFGTFWEERAVPSTNKNERWAFEARAVIAAGSDCAAVRAIPTERPSAIVCEEVGCYWKSLTEPVPTVTCSGTVATLSTAGATYQRDCARAFATCDPSSPTGCNDRRPVACTSGAKDACDGDIRLGCDGTGRVSYHDCSRLGGTCSAGACVPRDGGVCLPGAVGCDGETVQLCAQGKLFPLSRADVGITTCDAPKLP